MNNKEKDFAPSSWAINNSTTMYVVMALVLLLGINAYFNMPREEYPEIKENIVFVSSIYPGNTAEDVESLHGIHTQAHTHTHVQCVYTI